MAHEHEAYPKGEPAWIIREANPAEVPDELNDGTRGKAGLETEFSSQVATPKRFAEIVLQVI